MPSDGCRPRKTTLWSCLSNVANPGPECGHGGTWTSSGHVTALWWGTHVIWSCGGVGIGTERKAESSTKIVLYFLTTENFNEPIWILVFHKVKKNAEWQHVREISYSPPCVTLPREFTSFKNIYWHLICFTCLGEEALLVTEVALTVALFK